MLLSTFTDTSADISCVHWTLKSHNSICFKFGVHISVTHPSKGGILKPRFDYGHIRLKIVKYGCKPKPIQIKNKQYIYPLTVFH